MPLSPFFLGMGRLAEGLRRAAVCILACCNGTLLDGLGVLLQFGDVEQLFFLVVLTLSHFIYRTPLTISPSTIRSVVDPLIGLATQ